MSNQELVNDATMIGDVAKKLRKFGKKYKKLMRK